MSKIETSRAAELAVVLARKFPNASVSRIAIAVAHLQRAAAAHQRDAEIECSYPRTEAQEARAEMRLARLSALAMESVRDCASLPEYMTGVTLKWGGDPRGPCAWIEIDGMQGDGWGDGFAIYR